MRKVCRLSGYVSTGESHWRRISFRVKLCPLLSILEKQLLVVFWALVKTECLIKEHRVTMQRELPIMNWGISTPPLNGNGKYETEPKFVKNRQLIVWAGSSESHDGYSCWSPTLPKPTTMASGGNSLWPVSRRWNDCGKAIATGLLHYWGLVVREILQRVELQAVYLVVHPSQKKVNFEKKFGLFFKVHR